MANVSGVSRGSQRFLGRPCELCGGQSNTGKGYSARISAVTSQFSFHYCFWL